MNDFSDIFDESCNPPYIDENTPIYCLQYADDIVLFSESESGLQSALNKTDIYCKRWGLRINLDKTKIIVVGCSLKSAEANSTFTLGDRKVSVVKSYNYLGLIIQNNRFFNEARDNRLQKGRRCIYSLIGKVINHNIDFDTALHIFDHAASPLILYGSEFWNMPDFNSKKFQKFEEYYCIEEVYRDNPLETILLKYLNPFAASATNLWQLKTPFSGRRHICGSKL